MTIKYLYGKEEILSPLLNGESGIRISDLTHYSRMENENMRDNEMEKIFHLDKNAYSIEVNGVAINPESIIGYTTLTLQPRHCYCICLSSRKNEPELYRKFKADICIAFDVELLIERIKLLNQKFNGMLIVGRGVTYYKKGTLPKTLDPLDLVFYKPELFSHEAEYRIALFYPLDKTGFKYAKGVIPFRKNGESMHMFLSHKQSNFITSCIKEVFKA